MKRSPVQSSNVDAQIQESGTAIALRAQATAAQWTPSFAVAVEEMVDRVNAKHDFFNRVMRKDEHYGAIPGGSAKPVLLKPGAELLLASMGLFVELVDAEPPVREYDASRGEPMIAYRRICRIYKQTGPAEHDRMRVAQAEGFCTSRETKYRWRESKRHCPVCGVEAIIRGKAEYGGGWLCFKKRRGCGAKFAADDPAITSQVAGRVINPDVADLENTILKMADKRALVASALLATGCSDIFTQDIEDQAESSAEAPLDAPTAAASGSHAASNHVETATPGHNGAADAVQDDPTAPLTQEMYEHLKPIVDALPAESVREALWALTGRVDDFTQLQRSEAHDAYVALRKIQLDLEARAAEHAGGP
ncbi:MAG: hypothetical protein ACYDCJ_12380 [Gammaproteobacteria bacterium]